MVLSFFHLSVICLRVIAADILIKPWRLDSFIFPAGNPLFKIQAVTFRIAAPCISGITFQQLCRFLCQRVDIAEHQTIDLLYPFVFTEIVGQPVAFSHLIKTGIFFQQDSGTAGMYLFAGLAVTVYACLEAAKVVEVGSLIHVAAFPLNAIRKGI